MTTIKTKWFTAAPPARSRKLAQARLDACITDPIAHAKYRIIKKGSRWLTQYPTKNATR